MSLNRVEKKETCIMYRERSAVATVRVDTYHVPSNIRVGSFPGIADWHSVIGGAAALPNSYVRMSSIRRRPIEACLAKAKVQTYSPPPLVAVAKIRLQGHVSA